MPLPKPSVLLSNCFTQPFNGLLVFVWVFFIWTFLMFPLSPILSGHFYDSDDYTYLTHTLDWLKGQSWYDTIQHRMNPPDGVPIHFSRIEELPIAALITFWRALGMNWGHAAAATAALWPMALLAFLLLALRWVANDYLPRNWVRVTAFIALFATALLFQYSPGRIDHHGTAMLITLLASGATLRFLLNPNQLRSAALAGFLLALGQVIALETLPYLLIMAAIVGFWMIVRGKEMALPGTLFGTVLTAASAGFLMILKTPDMWFDEDLVAFSAAYVEMAYYIALCCAGVGCASLVLRPVWARFAFGLAALAIAGQDFFFRFPDLLEGPYGGADKNLTNLFFHNINEAITYVTKMAMSPEAWFRPLYAGMGVGSCVWFALRARNDRDVLRWFFSLALVGVPFLLMLFYQSRFVHYAQLFSIIPLTAAMRAGLAWADARWRGHKLSAIQLLILLMAGPIPSVLAPALFDNRSFNHGVVLFPAATSTARSCSDMALYQTLSHAPYVAKPRLIMNTIDEGAELLFRTPHSVVAAPYHTNTSGIMDSVRFFSTRDEAESERTIRETGAELVVLCKNSTDIYLSDPREPKTEKPVVTDATNPDQPKTIEDKPTMAKRLIDGKIPAWLKPVDYPLHGSLLLFEVLPPQKPEERPAPETKEPESPAAEQQPQPEQQPPTDEKQPAAETFGKAFGPEDVDMPDDLPQPTQPQAQAVQAQPAKHAADKPKTTMPAPDAGDGIKIP